ncbi:MAG: hypothetical protein IT273_02530 [Chitinophagales bacterium]|nr:hypothetical protein [Chitinophagales bacterium]
MLNKILFLMLTILSINAALHAQKVYDKSLFASQPIWIEMMDDPNVNYYEAVEAFNTYWKGRKIPPNKEKRQTDEYKTFFATLSIAERQEYERVFLHYKRFKNWMRNEKSWVQPDGSLLPEAEKQVIIDQQEAELRAIERANGKND